ncbi:MAG: DUF5340 family protein [Cyanobacteria bacterium P01_H01_bin.119]
MDQPVPLPSHIHYELLLQLLERETLFAVQHLPQQRLQVNELIITLRKALSQQRNLEEGCERADVPVEYHWSLNNGSTDKSSMSSEILE